MNLDEMVVRSHPGEGVVGRFGGIAIVIVPGSPGQEAMVDPLLTMAEGATGPTPGRRLARQIAGLLSSTDPDEMPAFGLLAQADNGLVLILHGAMDAHVSGPLGDEYFSGSQVATWVDRILPPPLSGLVVTPSGTPSSPDPRSRLVAGVVTGAGISLFPSATRAAPAQVTPAAAPTAPPAAPVAPPAPPAPTPPVAAASPAPLQALIGLFTPDLPAPAAAPPAPAPPAPAPAPAPPAPPPVPPPAPPAPAPAAPPLAPPAPVPAAPPAPPPPPAPAPALPPAAPSYAPAPSALQPSVWAPSVPSAPAPAVEADEPTVVAPSPTDPTPAEPRPFTAFVLAEPLPEPEETREPLPIAGQATHAPEEPQGPRVRGVICSRGHFNDPAAPFCSVCGISMVQRTLNLVEGPRPPLGIVVFDDGTTYTLDTDYVLGREPENDPSVIAGTARALAVADPDRTVSRVHAGLVIDGWNVKALDRGSANGTFIAGPGDDNWVPLIPYQPTAIKPGTRIRVGQRVLIYDSHQGTR